MTGQPLPRATGLRLLLGGSDPGWLQVPAGQTQPIRGLPGGASYQLIRVAGGWVAQPFPSGSDGCVDCGPPPAVYYIADGSRAASRIGTADLVAPAAAPGALWLVSYQLGADVSVAAGTAREVSVAGAPLGPPVRLPAGYVIDQGTSAGLLLMPEQSGSGALVYQLWDSGTRRVTRSFANVVAASPAEIAWAPDCTARCLVDVLDLSSGRSSQIALPGPGTVYTAAFSPDGQLLALQVSTRFAADGSPAATQLMVATVASGRIAALPGSTVGIDNGVSLGWQPGSRRLIADVTVRVHGGFAWQIAVWQPGDARLSTAVVQVPSQSWPVIDQGPY